MKSSDPCWSRGLEAMYSAPLPVSREGWLAHAFSSSLAVAAFVEIDWPSVGQALHKSPYRFDLLVSFRACSGIKLRRHQGLVQNILLKGNGTDERIQPSRVRCTLSLPVWRARTTITVSDIGRKAALYLPSRLPGFQACHLKRLPSMYCRK